MKNEKLKKIIYLPVQHVTRDLASRLLLANTGAQSGWVVVLVRAKWLVANIEKIPRGVVFFGTSPTVIDQVKQIKAAGHYYVAECDEAAMWNKERYLTFKAALPNLLVADLYLAWGIRHASLIAERNATTSIVTTGSPRLDLSLNSAGLFKNAASNLKDKYGRYILITSNGLLPFSKYNRKSIKNVVSDLSNRFPGMSKAEYEKSFGEFIKNGEAFWSLTKAIIKNNPDINFLYRPRFGDKISTIIQELSIFKNVSVVATGPINALIIASEGVIHQNCTSGLESALMGRPTIDYSPISLTYPFEVAENALPFTVSAEEVDRFVKKVWCGEGAHEYIVSMEKISPYIYNCNSERSSSDLIIDTLNSLCNVDFKSESILSLKKFKHSEAATIYKVRETENSLKSLIKRIFSARKFQPGFAEPLSAATVKQYSEWIGIGNEIVVKEVSQGEAYLLSSSRRPHKGKETQ